MKSIRYMLWIRIAIALMAVCSTKRSFCAQEWDDFNVDTDVWVLDDFVVDGSADSDLWVLPDFVVDGTEYPDDDWLYDYTSSDQTDYSSEDSAGSGGGVQGTTTGSQYTKQDKVGSCAARALTYHLQWLKDRSGAPLGMSEAAIRSRLAAGGGFPESKFDLPSGISKDELVAGLRQMARNLGFTVTTPDNLRIFEKVSSGTSGLSGSTVETINASRLAEFTNLMQSNTFAVVRVNAADLAGLDNGHVVHMRYDHSDGRVEMIDPANGNEYKFDTTEDAHNWISAHDNPINHGNYIVGVDLPSAIW